MNETHDRDFDSDDGSRQQAQKSRLPIILKFLIVMAITGVLIALLLPAVRTAGTAAHRNTCQNNLKQIALGLLIYAEKHGALPPAYTTDKDGKPLHSWRTLILPFIEEEPLYKSIDLTKPWDDPVNAEAFKTAVSVYHCPANPDRDNRTTYLAVVTPDSCFRATQPRNLAEITDKPSQTLMVIEVDLDHAVPWMKPVDADEQLVMNIDEKSNRAHPGGTTAVFVDGHVAFLTANLSPDQRRAIISAAGNDHEAATWVE